MNNLKLKNKGTLYSTIEQFGTIDMARCRHNWDSQLRTSWTSIGHPRD